MEPCTYKCDKFIVVLDAETLLGQFSLAGWQLIRIHPCPKSAWLQTTQIQCQIPST